MFAWRSLDPKMTAQVILILTQRLLREAARPPNAAGCAGCGLDLTGWLRPRLVPKEHVDRLSIGRLRPEPDNAAGGLAVTARDQCGRLSAYASRNTE
jgi:hypothetical protein